MTFRSSCAGVLAVLAATSGCGELDIGSQGDWTSALLATNDFDACKNDCTLP